MLRWVSPVVLWKTCVPGMQDTTCEYCHQTAKLRKCLELTVWAASWKKLSPDLFGWWNSNHPGHLISIPEAANVFSANSLGSVKIACWHWRLWSHCADAQWSEPSLCASVQLGILTPRLLRQHTSRLYLEFCPKAYQPGQETDQTARKPSWEIYGSHT